MACPEVAEPHVDVSRPRLHIDLADAPAADAGSHYLDAATATVPDSAHPPPAAPDLDSGNLQPDNGRSILTPYLVNARDLGGTPVGHGAVVAYGRLFRGPPMAFSADGCSAFASLGIRSVIDLREPEEAASVPDSACVREHATLIQAPLPIPYSVSPHDYIAILDASASIAATFRVLGDPAAYPVYFHCTLGRDRTGVISALILLALGASHNDIVDEYTLSNASVGSFPYSLVSTLDEIDRRGGVEAYLTSVGVTREQLAGLRSAALR